MYVLKIWKLKIGYTCSTTEFKLKLLQITFLSHLSLISMKYQIETYPRE